MVIAMIVLSQCIEGLNNALENLGNLKKAKVAYRSVYSILNTPSTIPPFEEDNFGKLSAMNIKGKIELRHVYFAYPTRPENVILKMSVLLLILGNKLLLWVIQEAVKALLFNY